MFGDISDYIGRRLAMLLGLAASLIGVLLFAANGALDIRRSGFYGDRRRTFQSF